MGSKSPVCYSSAANRNHPAGAAYVGSCTTIGNRSKIIGRRPAEGVGFGGMKNGVRSEERGTGVLIVHRLQLPRNAPPTAS